MATEWFPFTEQEIADLAPLWAMLGDMHINRLYAAYRQQKMAPAIEPNPEVLGRMVRRLWIQWANEQPNPKPSWLVEWDDLSEPDKEVDRRIGAALFRVGVETAIRAMRP